MCVYVCMYVLYIYITICSQDLVNYAEAKMGVLYSSLIQRKNRVPRYLFSGFLFLMIKNSLYQGPSW